MGSGSEKLETVNGSETNAGTGTSSQANSRTRTDRESNNSGSNKTEKEESVQPQEVRSKPNEKPATTSAAPSWRIPNPKNDWRERRSKQTRPTEPETYDPPKGQRRGRPTTRPKDQIVRQRTPSPAPIPSTTIKLAEFRMLMEKSMNPAEKLTREEK